MEESPIEKPFREAAAGRWWPELPLVQEHPLTVEGQNYRLDFAVLDRRFGIELDGHATHSSTTAIANDRRRQRALERAGWTVCRFGGQEVWQDAVRCVQEAMTMLNAKIVDAVSDADRAWFDEHPFCTERWRPGVPGEFDFAFNGPFKVHVRVMPWGRVREPSGIPLQPDERGYPEPITATPELLEALRKDHAVAARAREQAKKDIEDLLSNGRI